MLPARFTILSVLAAALLAGQAYTAGAADAKPPKEVGKVFRKQQRYSEEEIKNERARLAAVGERVNQIFTLLGGETALQKGQAGTALATYMLMLERTKSPEVAERALEMAVSLNAFEQAEMIYQKWRQIEPIPGKAQKRAGWAERAEGKRKSASRRTGRSAGSGGRRTEPQGVFIVGTSRRATGRVGAKSIESGSPRGVEI